MRKASQLSSIIYKEGTSKEAVISGMGPEREEIEEREGAEERGPEERKTLFPGGVFSAFAEAAALSAWRATRSGPAFVATAFPAEQEHRPVLTAASSRTTRIFNCK